MDSRSGTRAPRGAGRAQRSEGRAHRGAGKVQRSAGMARRDAGRACSGAGRAHTDAGRAHTGAGVPCHPRSGGRSAAQLSRQSPTRCPGSARRAPSRAGRAGTRRAAADLSLPPPSLLPALPAPSCLGRRDRLAREVTPGTPKRPQSGVRGAGGGPERGLPDILSRSGQHLARCPVQQQGWPRPRPHELAKGARGVRLEIWG